jgi:hypothetical protein
VRGERNLTPTPVPDRPTATEPDPPRMSIPLRLASTARTTFDHSDRSRRRNLGTYLSSHTPPVLDTDEEEVVALPRSASPVEQEVVPAAPEPAQG